MLEREQTVAFSREDLDALPPEIRLREIIDGELFVNPSADWWHNRLALGIVALLDSHGEEIGQANLAPLALAATPWRPKPAAGRSTAGGGVSLAAGRAVSQH